MCFLKQKYTCAAVTEEHGYIRRGVHHWRGEDPLPLQGVPIPAGHDEFSE